MAIRIIDEVIPAATVINKGGIVVSDGLSIDNQGVLKANVLPDQTGNAGKFLKTDGVNVLWETLDGDTSIQKINNDLDTNTYLAGNTGTAILNNNSEPGTLVTFAKYPSTNGVFTTSGNQNELVVGYTSNDTIQAGTDGLDKKVTLLDENGDSSFPNNISAPLFNGTAYRANFADIAEKYESDTKYPTGTFIQFGGEKEITIAKTDVNGVISTKPAFTLHSKGKGQPVVLIGKTKARIIGKINKFDKIVLSNIPGIGRKKKWYDFTKKVIGIALETNLSSDEKQIQIFTKAFL